MSDSLEGRVLVSYGSHGIVELADGTRLDCAYRRQVGRPVCGDHVAVAMSGTHQGVVEDIRTRRNEFARADRRQRRQVIAANLDQVLIVVAARPAPSQDLLERYLVAVHSLGIQPVIVLNKVDLETSEPAAPASPALLRLPAYIQLGYTVLRTSCKGAPGTDALRAAVRDRTSILVGQSGVGKSSLVQRLLPDQDIQTGELSRVTGKGTHTTTTTILYRLPGGGHLIDSPGVWEFGLWKLDDPQLARGFPEFTPWLGQCKFGDCRHASEPGCAIKAAVEADDIRGWRYRSYLRLLQQNEAV